MCLSHLLFILGSFLLARSQATGRVAENTEHIYDNVQETQDLQIENIVRVDCSFYYTIPSVFLCDNEIDCIEGEDEANCEKGINNQIKYDCSLITIIPASFICDGDIDCMEGEDEANCTQTRVEAKRPKAFDVPSHIPVSSILVDCNLYNTIPPIFLCDNEIDCYGREDEENCPEKSDEEIFKYDNQEGNVTPTSAYDGEVGCDGGGDKENCTQKNDKGKELESNNEEGEKVNCSYFTDEFLLLYRCDGTEDCEGGEDEKGCSDNQEDSDLVLCSIIRADYVEGFQCNGVVECYGGADENNCSEHYPERQGKLNEIEEGLTKKDCSIFTEEFKVVLQCNGKIDCQDGEDEKDCPSQNESETSQIMCSIFKPQYLESLMCNGIVECIGGADEVNCSNQNRINGDESEVEDMLGVTTSENNTELVPCHTLSDEYLREITCDGEVDCIGGVDEEDCLYISKDLMYCSGLKPDFLQYLKCNGVIECKGGWDEENCTETDIKRVGEHIYLEDMFLDEKWNCTIFTEEFMEMLHCSGQDEFCADSKGVDGCPYPSDRLNSYYMCSFFKPEYIETYKCNGIIECFGGLDERDCPTESSVTSVPESENEIEHNDLDSNGEQFKKLFNCRQLKILPMVAICDVKQDCKDDNEDEDCFRIVTQSSDPRIFSVYDDATKQVFTMCDRMDSVPQDWRCNGIVQCLDGSDETDCQTLETTEQTRSSEYDITITNKTGSNLLVSCEFILPSLYLCDGQIDCVNGIDEKHCTDSKEAIGKEKEVALGKRFNYGRLVFNCENLQDIYFPFKCDGVYDCLDGRDEKGCY